jgi:hypothetical protein
MATPDERIKSQEDVLAAAIEKYLAQHPPKPLISAPKPRATPAKTEASPAKAKLKRVRKMDPVKSLEKRRDERYREYRRNPTHQRALFICIEAKGEAWTKAASPKEVMEMAAQISAKPSSRLAFDMAVARVKKADEMRKTYAEAQRQLEEDLAKAAIAELPKDKPVEGLPTLMDVVSLYPAATTGSRPVGKAGTTEAYTAGPSTAGPPTLEPAATEKPPIVTEPPKAGPSSVESATTEKPVA